MEGPRSPETHEFPKILEFLHRSLRPQTSQWHIEEEYPTALNLQNLNNMTVIFDQESIVSHAVTKHILVKTPAGAFKIGTIGSVVTAPEFRSQGFSSQVIEACLSKARLAGCDLALLWTNLFEFYRRLGFEQAGSEISFRITGPLTSPFTKEGLRFLESSQVDPEALLRVFNQHTITSHRTSEDIRRFLQIPNSDIYTAWDQTQKLVAYAVVGKGADLTNHIHEWGGNVSKLMPLLTHIWESRRAPLTFMVPGHCKNLLQVLRESRLTEHQGFLGMIQILNPESLVKKIQNIAAARGLSEFIFEYRNQELVFGSPAQIYKLQRKSEITRLIFGPGNIKDLIQVDRQTETLLQQVLPLPMWVWGWDSI